MDLIPTFSQQRRKEGALWERKWHKQRPWGMVDMVCLKKVMVQTSRTPGSRFPC